MSFGSGLHRDPINLVMTPALPGFPFFVAIWACMVGIIGVAMCVAVILPFFMVGIGMYVVSSITLPIPAIAKLGFTLFFIVLNCIIHEGEKLGNIQYPIFVSPIEHELHHVHRNCNYAAVFKLWDQIFGTYRES